MEQVLALFQKYWYGILVFIICTFSIFQILKSFLRFIAKLFCVGKYNIDNRKKIGECEVCKEDEEISFGRVVKDFFLQIIVDFRNLLALIVMMIFFSALMYAMVNTTSFEHEMEAIKSVVAALGGLVGSIIGYYFGESAGKKNSDSLSDNSKEPPIQGGELQKPNLTDPDAPNDENKEAI